jgi:methanogenic corrinoid protein MtbC1
MNGSPDRIKLPEALRRIGITKLVLHAWERRYDIKLCERTDTGRRFMTEEQVERLRLLKVCVDAGYRISGLIHRPDAALLELAQQHAHLLDLVPLLDAATRLDASTVESELISRLDVHGPVDFVRMIVVPLMGEIGRRWVDGRMSVASEHLVSAVVRQLLTSALADCPVVPGAPRAIMTTPEGELHEIGAIVAALLARSQEVDAVYLGPNLPNDQIVLAARSTCAQVVCLSSLAAREMVMQRRLETLRHELPADILLWIGGPGVEQIRAIDGIRYFASVVEFETALDTLKQISIPARCESPKT